METDYISREAAKAAIQNALNNGKNGEALNAVPAADVVEVVRCKDCRFSEKNSGFLSCDFFNIWNVKQDGFCSYGEWRIKNG